VPLKKQHANHDDFDQRSRSTDPDRRHPGQPENAEKTAENWGKDDELEFEVTEKNTDDREFVGGNKDFTEQKDTLADVPSIAEKELPSDDPETASQPEDDDIRPIGQSTPPLLPEDDPDTRDTSDSRFDRKGQVKKLSPEEIKEIEKNLYGGDHHLTDSERKDLMKKLDELEGKQEPFRHPEPPAPSPGTDTTEQKPDLPPPKMARRSKGIAYFYKNFIQLEGRHELVYGDELQIHNRVYELRPKQFNTKAIIAAAAVVFVVVLFLVGSQFVTSTGRGQGEIVGVVLDEYGQPYLRGATIVFPELGKSISTNSQGFFRSGLIPEGSHRVEYLIDDRLVKVDYATVTDGNITMLSLRPEEQHLASVAHDETAPPETTTPPAVADTKKPSGSTSGKTTRSAKKSSQKSVRKSKSKSPAKITLAANVDGARLELDGNVLGAGNLTYAQIKPGSHQYTVSKDGYQPVSGTIKLSPGQSKTLTVELLPLDEEQKAKLFSAEDYYYSGLAALKDMDIERAIGDLTKAIEREPSYAEAYLARAEAYALTKQSEPARDDYIRAAEIFRIRNDLNQAITAYNNAIKLDKKSVTAYLGRADTYLAKGEEIAAIADYKAVIDLDKRNAQAYFGLGKARFRQGQYKKAVKNFKNARAIDSDNPLIYQYLMLSYLAMDDIKKVKKSFEKFEDVATEAQMARLRSDPRFSAVLRIVEKD
jgi:tetratricopeptide (TPR) repeat protein